MQAVTGLSEGTPRKSLVQAYMQQLCDPELKLEKNKDFLARGADTGGKGDYQGCSEFNPVLIFSQHDQQRFEQAKDKTERNATNAPNRRVMVLLFRKGSKVDPAKWPCPSVKDGIAGCKQRFWSDGEMRRSKRLPDQPRTFPDTQDTFACRFYHRMTTGSPCSQPAPPATVCRFGILGPPDVPGLSKYKYKIDIPADKTPTNITWTVDKPTAGFEEQTDQIEVVVTYQNTKPDWIKLKATFTLDGKNECAEKQIALVKVEVGVATFTNPAKAAGHSTGTKIFLVNPPAPPAAPVWVTKHDPGSDTAAFTYNGTNQPAEPRKFVDSQAGGGGAAYKAVTPVKLISPPEKPTALQKIQVGYIQHGSDAGSATYATTPAGGARTVTIPTTGTVDWLAPSATDEWPWYDQSSRETGSGSGTWSKPDLTLEDSPGLSIPAQYNPNNAGDPNTTKPINTARETFAFIIRIAARTLDSDLEADKHYFDEGNSTWTVNFVWPVVPGISIVTTGAAWTTPGSPSEVSVNVIPTSTNHNSPFLRWTP
ncbi:MAG: hypothetical protein HY267_04970 [Deltaproteobacteria bacterium]|nr:hypothetical protein [Deltaproteobacteria bacterium]